MSTKQPNHVLNYIFTGQWAIDTRHLNLMIGIASREIKDMQTVLATPMERRQSGTIKVRDGVAVISVFGPIFPRADIFSDISGATSVDTLALRFGEAINAPDVKAIILHMDSPGGNITGINEFANLIYESRGAKPIIAYASGLCASAAYWIASAADKIIADETAFLGSIGVVATWTDDSEARKAKGLTDYEVVSSQSPDKRQDPNSEEGRAKLQSELDALADIFINSVARNRNTNAAFIGENYGKGGVLIADEAVNIGMADRLGSLESVIAELSNDNNIFTTINKGATVMSNPKKDDEDEEATASKKEDEEKDDEEEEAKAKASTTETQMTALLASNPSLYNAIKQVGVAEERARIKSIDDIGMASGYADLVKSAKYDNPTTAANLALQIVKADKATMGKAAADYKADAKEAGEIPASSADKDSDNGQNALLMAMTSGIKAGGGREVKHG